MYPNNVVRGPGRFHERSVQNPSPRRLREPNEWPLVVPFMIILLGLVGIGLYIASQWPSISTSF